MNNTFSSSRYSYKDSGMTLLFVLPSNKTLFSYVFYSLVSLLWICLLFTVVYWQIYTIQALQSIPLIFIFLVSDGLMACFGLFILWQLIGYEVLKVDNHGIRISYKVLYSELFPKRYHHSHICNLRISVPKTTYASGLLAENSYWDKYRGYIVFDYKGEACYLGKGLGGEESEEVLHIIKNRFPQYF